MRKSDLTFAGPPCATQERAHWPVSRLWVAMVTNYTLPGARLVSSTMKPTVATVARTSCGWTLAVLYARCCAEARAWTARWRPAQERTPTAARPTARIYTDSLILALAALTIAAPSGWAGRLPAAELPWSALSMKLGRPLVRGAQVAAARQRAGAQEDRMEVASPSPRPWRLLGCEGPLHAGLGFSA